MLPDDVPKAIVEFTLDERGIAGKWLRTSRG
jgi:hypothetical protein